MRLVKAGLLDRDDILSSQTSISSRCSFREHTMASLRRVSLSQQQLAQGSVKSLSRRSSLTVEAPQHLRTASRSASRRATEMDFLLSDLPGGSGTGGRRITGGSGFGGGPSSRPGSRRATEQDSGFEPFMRHSGAELPLAQDGREGSPMASGRVPNRRNSFIDRFESSQSLKSMTDALAGLEGRTRSFTSMSRRQTEDSISIPERSSGSYSGMSRRLSVQVDNQVMNAVLATAPVKQLNHI